MFKAQVHTERPDCLIIGGGIAGMAAAIAMARAGHQVELCEQAERFEEVGAGLQLGPNSVRALKEIGAWKNIEAAACRPKAIIINDGATGQLLKELPLNEVFESRFDEPYRVIHRADLLKGLLQTAGEYDRIKLFNNEQLASSFFEDGQVVARFSDGSDIRPKIMIGADGIHSKLREVIAPTSKQNEILWRSIIYRSLMDMPKNLPANMVEKVNLWLMPGGHIVSYPLRGGTKLNLVAVSAKGRLGKAGFDEVFSDLPKELSQLTANVSEWLRWPGGDRKADKNWWRGNLLLIGDAVHPVLPYLAQGAAMALEDSAVLSKIAVGPIDQLPDQFEAFSRQRFERTSRVMMVSRRQGQIDHMDGIMRVSRNKMIQLLPAEFQFKRLAWLYEWAP